MLCASPQVLGNFAADLSPLLEDRTLGQGGQPERLRVFASSSRTPNGRDIIEYLLAIRVLRCVPPTWGRGVRSTRIVGVFTDLTGVIPGALVILAKYAAALMQVSLRSIYLSILPISRLPVSKSGVSDHSYRRDAENRMARQHASAGA